MQGRGEEKEEEQEEEHPSSSSSTGRMEEMHFVGAFRKGSALEGALSIAEAGDAV
jgi:hypothetical protein